MTEKLQIFITYLTYFVVSTNKEIEKDNILITIATHLLNLGHHLQLLYTRM